MRSLNDIESMVDELQLKIQEDYVAHAGLDELAIIVKELIHYLRVIEGGPERYRLTVTPPPVPERREP
jgi:hypothetical protein